ncbi:MAG: M81 family metallopeptidase [Gammaproteobacteria bacterium]|nr:M81 family metallopeptidase [Gammaproteobacteria bacterium]
MTRVFASALAHETHGFNRFATTLDDFRRYHFGVDDEIMDELEGDTGWAGLFEVARENDWEVVHPLSAFCMPSGPATNETFETLWGIAEKSLRADGPFDAVLWFLHGGMMCEGVDDPEGEIVRRTRDIVGPGVPMAVWLDIHANVSPEMVQLADIICGFHTTPHVDLKGTGLRAARLLQRTLSGEIRPVTYSVHPPVLAGIDHGRTTDPGSPIPRMLKHAEEIQASDPTLLDVSFFSGFPFCDTAVTGASAIVVADGEHERFETLADEFGNEIWKTRDQITIDFVTMDEAIDCAEAETDKSGPYLIGDFSDTPHGGGYGDAPDFLRTLIRREVPAAVFGPIWDPMVVDDALSVGPGADLDVVLGGHSDPEHGGAPLETQARVVSVSESGDFVHKGPFSHGTPGSLGPSVRLSVGGVDVIVVKQPDAIYDREQLRIFGIEPEAMNVLVFKAYNHMRADYEPICRGLVYADSGGIFNFDFSRFNYTKVRRPIWPLDRIGQSEGETFRAHTNY